MDYYNVNIKNFMNNFTSFITESQKKNDSGSLLSTEIAKYLNKVNKVIPRNVKEVIYLTQKYNLLDSSSIEEIKNANKGSLDKLSDKYNIPSNNMEMLWKLLKELKSNIKMLPQFMSSQEREEIELGKLSLDDLTIDLTTSQGRNAAAKMYMPVIYKVVNQYVGKSNFTKNDLMSSALVGLTNAMNEWDSEKGSFKTYAAYRAKQQILNDIDAYSHTLSGTNWYASKVYGASLLDATSIDGWMGDDEFKQDRLAELGMTDADYNLTRNEEKQWNALYDRIESQFKQRDIDIFYRYFGLKGYKREKSKDIAKSFGMSEGNIRNSVINKILSFLKKDKKSSDILQNIQDVYNESLMVELFGLEREEIMEALISNDMFILLEELNKWNNKEVFKNAIEAACYNLNQKECEIIKSLLNSDFEHLDDNFKKNKKLIILFLSNLYPSENISRKTDISILEYMEELQDYYKKYK